MKFVFKSNMELADTVVPDIFICEYMKQLDFNSMKLYLFILYINKSKKEISLDNICKMLTLTKDELNKAFLLLEEKGLLVKTEKEYMIKDLKEAEIEKIYTPKLDCKSKLKKKNDPEKEKLFKAVNDTFFGGNMSTRWYIDINTYLDKFKFDNDVILALFTTCKKNQKLYTNYVQTVADSWNRSGIKTASDLNDYYEQQSMLRKTESKIKKFLRTSNNLTEPEMKMVSTWITEYKFDYKVIEKALMKTSGKQNPLVYANKVLQNWNAKGIKEESDIFSLDNGVQEVKTQIQPVNKKPTSNFEKRKYTNLDSLFDNM